ncbi:hypothetical protein Y032_0018g3623 [Ancylostoma ceylanicum]|nr:hypothetical protein Y032_0018g3623 [Ancylostoma ceylanicum]
MAREYTEAELLNDIAEMDCRERTTTATKGNSRTAEGRIQELEETVRLLKGEQRQKGTLETDGKDHDGIWEDYNTPQPEVVEIIKGFRQDAQEHCRQPYSTRPANDSREARDQGSSGRSDSESKSPSELGRGARRLTRDRRLEMYFKQTAIPPVEPFGAKEQQALSSFIASFKQKYPAEHWADVELRILFWDLLRGKARKQYDSMPRENREAPFEDMIDYFRERIEGGEQARQLMTYADLRRMRLRKGQSVTEFCISLESLTKTDFPDVAEEALSALVAHKLYDQFAASADPYHIMEAMESPEGGAAGAYTRAKEAALGCERSSSHRKRYYGDE